MSIDKDLPDMPPYYTWRHWVIERSNGVGFCYLCQQYLEKDDVDPHRVFHMLENSK